MVLERFISEEYFKGSFDQPFFCGESDTTPSLLLESTKERKVAIILVLICSLLSLTILFVLYQKDLCAPPPAFLSSAAFKDTIGYPTHVHLSEKGQYTTSHVHKHAIVIDAGSQGTRMHIYELEFCNNFLVAVNKDYFSSVSTSLASLAATPSPFLIGPKLIDPLLLKALQLIPANEHSTTPISMRATAGMRLLPAEQVDALLSGAKRALSKYPFLLVDDVRDSVELISGTSEGIWAWISVNFLYKNFLHDCGCNITTPEAAHHPIPSTQEQSSNSVVDLGGISLQIISEISEEEAQLIAHIEARLVSDLVLDEYQPYDLVHPVRFQGRPYLLFVHSFLNYGYQTVRSLVMLDVCNTVLGTSFTSISSTHSQAESIATGKVFPVMVSHPCFTNSLMAPIRVIVSMGSGHSGAAHVNITRSPGSSWSRCTAIVSSTLNIKPCKYSQCSFNGVPFPRSMLKRKNEIINLSSHFSSVLGPLLELLPKYGGTEGFLSSMLGLFRKQSQNIHHDHASSYKDISLHDIEHLGKIICSPLFTKRRYPDIFKVFQDSHPSILSYLCLDMSYIYVMMTEGFHLPKKGPGSFLRVEMKNVKNGYRCWTLGAAMNLFKAEEH